MLFKSINQIPKRYRLSSKVNITTYPLNGKFIDWKRKFFDVESPILIKNEKNEELKRLIIGKYPLMDKKTSLKILDIAYKSYDNGNGFWPSISDSERIKYFELFLEEFNCLKEDVVKLLMWEIGKNYEDSNKEFDRTRKYIQETIDELKIKLTYTNNLIHEEDYIGKIKRSPLGVVMCMGPYNYPLNESFTTIIPALIMGNVVIFKPPKKGVLLHKKIIELFVKCFPKGVFNVVYGRGEDVIKPIMESGKISVLAFIGSSNVANSIQRYHPKPNRLKLVLGLEAKNVAIILDDADIENAVEECLMGTLSFNGQRCTAIKLIYIHEKIKDEFIKKFTKRVDSLNIGLPFENTFLTVCHEEKIEYYNQLLNDALKKGAKLINKKNKDYGTIYNPKILFPVNSSMRIYKEEQFGPIIPIATFTNIKKPIQSITNSVYGQQCAIFSNNPKKVGNIIDQLINQVSRININSQCQRGPDSFPFGGRKDSAVETLSVSDALKVFSIKTLVSAKISEGNKILYKQIVEKNYSSFLNKDIIL